jgi:hypothetical protein
MMKFFPKAWWHGQTLRATTGATVVAVYDKRVSMRAVPFNVVP